MENRNNEIETTVKKSKANIEQFTWRTQANDRKTPELERAREEKRGGGEGRRWEIENKEADESQNQLVKIIPELFFWKAFVSSNLGKKLLELTTESRFWLSAWLPEQATWNWLFRFRGKIDSGRIIELTGRRKFCSRNYQFRNIPAL